MTDEHEILGVEVEEDIVPGSESEDLDVDAKDTNKTVDDQDDQDDQDDPAQTEHKKNKPGSQKYKERAQKLARENEFLRDQMMQVAASRQQVAQPNYQRDPDPAEFNTYEQYNAAVIASQLRNAKQELAYEIDLKRRNDEWNARLGKASKELPGFDEAIEEFNAIGKEVGRERPDLVQVVGNAIMESDIGPKLAWYIGKNPEFTDKLAKMSTHKAVLALGRLEAVLDKSVPSHSAQKTPPIAPQRGGVAKPNKVDAKYDRYKSF